LALATAEKAKRGMTIAGFMTTAGWEFND